MSHNSQCLYVGSDWIIFVCPAGYDYSEMLAPGVILSKPGCSLRCELSADVSFQSYAFLHASNVSSKANAEGFLVLYFDPLSAEGRSVTHALAGEPFKQLTTTPADWSAELFDDLCLGNVPMERVIALVESFSECYLDLQNTPNLDERLKKVKQLLADSDGGRLQLDILADSVSVSAVHLRQSFKKQAGMTLSGYKTWLQFITFLLCTAQAEAEAEAEADANAFSRVYSWRIGNTLHDAGFYDDAHGFRTMQRYFGARSAMKQFELHYVDCRNYDEKVWASKI